MIALKDIIEAQQRLDGRIARTPLLRVPALDELAGCKVFVKAENLQLTGSFKIRGATNSLLLLTEEQKRCGIVTASSGNHAKAVCYAAQQLGLDVCVVMPQHPNPAKLEAIRALGATVLFAGTASSERAAKARELQQAGRVLVHSHADETVIAGQGTIGLEILEDCPSIDTIVVPIGGGGLISGIATAVKHRSSQTRIVGVEPAGAPRYTKSLQAGHPITLEHVDTIADGTRCDHADAGNYQRIKELVDEIGLVDEQAIKAAMRACIEHAKIVAEPSSCLPLACAMGNSLSFRRDEQVCFVVTGGNNDFGLLKSIL